MKRTWLLFLSVTLLELWAYKVYRDHPLLPPAYFKPALLCIEGLICWSAVDAARWLLRRSPVAERQGPTSDWVKLWLWLGPAGGCLLTLACFLGRIMDSASSHVAGLLIVAHISGGAILWLLASSWAMPELFSDSAATPSDKAMALLGFLAHMVGLWVWVKIYPAKLSLLTILAPITYFALVLYYILAASLVWDLFFRASDKRRS